MRDDRESAAWAAVAAVPDPELPALTLGDLGIVREVRSRDGRIEVVLTTTYSGCPATEVIERSVLDALAGAGLAPAAVERRLAPAWTTDWISAEGRRKLLAYGIVPPGPAAAVAGEAVIRVRPRRLDCPRCGSDDTERLAAFGSTACKALHRCRACGEPFEHFKPL